MIFAKISSRSFFIKNVGALYIFEIKKGQKNGKKNAGKSSEIGQLKIVERHRHMHIRIDIYIHVHIHIHIHIRTYTYTYIYTSTHAHTHIHIHTYTCTYTYTLDGCQDLGAQNG